MPLTQDPRTLAMRSGAHVNELLAGVNADWRLDEHSAGDTAARGERSLEQASSELTAIDGKPLQRRTPAHSSLGYGPAARRASTQGSPIFGTAFGHECNGSSTDVSNLEGYRQNGRKGGRGRSASPVRRESEMPGAYVVPRGQWALQARVAARAAPVG